MLEMPAMDDWRVRARLGVKWLEAPGLAAMPWLIHAFSTRLAQDGERLSRNFDLSLPTAVKGRTLLANRDKFLQALGAADFELAALRQIHSDRILEAVAVNGQPSFRPPGFPESQAEAGECQGDALVTNQAGILVSVRTADCTPILLVDVKRRVIAAVHAGWRGTLKRIVEKTVGEMRRVFNSRPEDMVAAIGPAIQGCCYQVGPEVVSAFSGAFPNARDFIERPRVPVEDALKPAPPSFLSPYPPGHEPGPEAAFRLNLPAAARHQLEATGVPHQSILVSGACTACQNDWFFSFRKEGERAGRMMAVIGIRSLA
jgi:YfiH family protein